MESKAKLKYAKIGPRKVRRVTDLIKGKKAGEALSLLKFMPQHASRVVEKLLKSAIANAEQKNIGEICCCRNGSIANGCTLP